MRLRRLLAVACSVVVLVACQPAPATWKDIPPSADAIVLPYSKAPSALVERLRSRLAERNLVEISNRVERLAQGVDWDTHLRWRDQHDGLLLRRGDRVPEPDAPVLYAEFSQGARTLFVIGAVDETGKQLVVLTALTKPA
jgi:hypothetical protein